MSCNEDKDCHYKIQILKNALIQEKQKVHILEEEIASVKEKLAIEEKKEKVENKEINNNQITNNDNYQVNHFDNKRTEPLTTNEYEMMLCHLEVQNENLKKTVNQSSQSIILIKNSFQNIIAEQSNTISKLNENTELISHENLKLQQSLKEFMTTNKKYEIENLQLKKKR